MINQIKNLQPRLQNSRHYQASSSSNSSAIKILHLNFRCLRKEKTSLNFCLSTKTLNLVFKFFCAKIGSLCFSKIKIVVVFFLFLNFESTLRCHSKKAKFFVFLRKDNIWGKKENSSMKSLKKKNLDRIVFGTTLPQKKLNNKKELNHYIGLGGT